jgi:hypothetical protein
VDIQVITPLPKSPHNRSGSIWDSHREERAIPIYSGCDAWPPLHSVLRPNHLLHSREYGEMIVYQLPTMCSANSLQSTRDLSPPASGTKSCVKNTCQRRRLDIRVIKEFLELRTQVGRGLFPPLKVRVPSIKPCSERSVSTSGGVKPRLATKTSGGRNFRFHKRHHSTHPKSSGCGRVTLQVTWKRRLCGVRAS